jgi:hypothetical protein
MSRLITGEFNTRMEADRVIDDLVRAGIPREQIYVETELPPDTERGRKGGEVSSAEAERRAAGLQTGAITGAILGLMFGIGMAMMGHIVWLTSGSAQTLGWPWESSVWSVIVGCLIGLLAGVVLGATVDSTLTRLGAGPARPREECLITVRCDDGAMETTRDVFFNRRARHVLAAEMAG